MTNLKEYRADYYSLSGKASDISRQLSFAGIALIWIFKAEKGGPLSFPPDLLWPALLFAAALAFDLMQYVTATLIWGSFSRYHEWKGRKYEDEIDAPVYLNAPALFSFWAKLTIVVAAYYLILEYVYSLIKLPL